MAIGDAARDLAIRTVLGEAGGESPMGWAAVAHVMKNRADSGLWGDPFNGGLTNAIRAPKQFTVWNPGNEAGARAMRYQASDPLYQRVGQVVDGVFGGQIPDPTGGATNYYALKGMETGQPPDWAGGGTNVRQIGNHTFMTLPLNAGPNAGRTYAQPSAQQPGAQPYAPAPAQGVNTPIAGSQASAPSPALQYLTSISDHRSRLGDTSNMHPEMVNRLAAALYDANSQGLNLTMMSGYRDPMETWNQGRRDNAAYYDASGKSSHSYGIAADVGGLDGANGPKTQAWARIAARYGLYNPYGTGNAAEFNHWQLLPYALETNPQQLAALKAAAASGQGMSAVWNVAMPVQGTVPYLGTQTTGMMVPVQPATSATSATQPAPATGAPQAPQAQPMSQAQMVEQQAERQQASAMQSIANIGQQIAAPPPPPPPLQPQYPTAGQAPVESPGIQPTTAGDSSSSASPDQPALSPPSAPAGATFDPFKYRKQSVAFPSGVSATPA
jgi:hypothetical protein